MALWLILVLRPDFPAILKYLNRKQEELQNKVFHTALTWSKYVQKPVYFNVSLLLGDFSDFVKVYDRIYCTKFRPERSTYWILSNQKSVPKFTDFFVLPVTSSIWAFLMS